MVWGRHPEPIHEARVVEGTAPNLLWCARGRKLVGHIVTDRFGQLRRTPVHECAPDPAEPTVEAVRLEEGLVGLDRNNEIL